MLKENIAGYSKEKNVLGLVIEYSLLERTATLRDFDGVNHTVPLEGIVEVEYIGDYQSEEVYDGDVFVSELTGEGVELVKVGDKVSLRTLDEKLNYVDVGEVGAIELDEMVKVFEQLEFVLVGNIHQMREELEQLNTELESDVSGQDNHFDFNLKIVKEKLTNGKYQYYYAGNNKEEEEVDLISVIFMGAGFHEGKPYERFTVDYDQYLELVDSALIDVSPAELQEYAMKLMSGELDEEEDEYSTYYDNKEDDEVEDDEGLTFGKAPWASITPEKFAEEFDEDESFEVPYLECLDCNCTGECEKEEEEKAKSSSKKKVDTKPVGTGSGETEDKPKEKAKKEKYEECFDCGGNAYNCPCEVI